MEKEKNLGSHKPNYTLATILIVLGIIFLISNFIPEWNFDKLWPVILIIIGLSILYRKK